MLVHVNLVRFAHRDVKPENFLFHDPSPESQLKACCLLCSFLSTAVSKSCERAYLGYSTRTACHGPRMRDVRVKGWKAMSLDVRKGPSPAELVLGLLGRAQSDCHAICWKNRNRNVAILRLQFFIQVLSRKKKADLEREESAKPPATGMSPRT